MPQYARQAGYLELLRTNANFRRLWIGTLISQLGDWFNTIAIYQLINTLTGSPLAMGGVFLFKLLPWALISPFAGILVDRLNRRHVMIISDVLRALVVLGFLFIDSPEQVPLIYLLITLQVVIGAVFLPAKSASIPNITKPENLLTANAISSATWSVMLALGAGLGGIATETIGTNGVFIIDSLTYVVSAFFIYRTVIPQQTDKSTPSPFLRSAYNSLRESWVYMLTMPRVGRIAFAKAAWAVGGGATVYMLTLIGPEIFPGAQATGIGILFFARGLGTGIGPIIARALFKDQRIWPAILGLSIVLSGVFYSTIGFYQWPLWVIAAIVFAHAASGANWVLATVLLQQRSEDRLRGRVFATEWLLVLFTESVSILLASILLELGYVQLDTAFVVFAFLQIVSGALWLLIVVPAERKSEPPPLHS